MTRSACDNRDENSCKGSPMSANQRRLLRTNRDSAGTESTKSEARRSVLFVVALVGVLATFFANISASAADVDPLHSVPGSCNAVAVMQMKQLINSPLGKRGKWWDEARRAYAEGLLSGPPWVNEIVPGASPVTEPASMDAVRGCVLAESSRLMVV